MKWLGLALFKALEIKFHDNTDIPALDRDDNTKKKGLAIGNESRQGLCYWHTDIGPKPTIPIPTPP